MEFNQILELIDHVSASELTAFTYETDDLTLTMEHGKPQIIQGVMGETVENIPAAGIAGGKVRRAAAGQVAAAQGRTAAGQMNAASIANFPVEGNQAAEMLETERQNNQSAASAMQGDSSQLETAFQSGSAPSEAVSDQSGNLVTSPLVGTFYAAPSQDLPPYVQVGDKVKKGQVLAIVEAMKLMNEIESDFDGEIAEIYVENGKPVEYGQKLFRIK